MWLHIITLTLVITILFERCESTFRYYLYNGGTTSWTELSSNGLVPDTLWDFDSDVKVLIHGWNSKPNAVDFDVLDRHFMIILAQEYGKHDSALNIIVVDWKSLATAPTHEYPNVIHNVKPAGILIANYLLKLLETGAIKDLDSIHLLGLSLGAHVAGATGNEIQNLMGGEKISRITGFDPAGPGFTSWNGAWPADMSVVLDYPDADFVDIIHTNMGPLGLGTDLQTGHVDFYPNGGEAQSFQCNHLQNKFESCSHQMAVLFYAQALRSPYIYSACPCESYLHFVLGFCQCQGTGNLLGELTTTTTSGRYYITIQDPISKQSFE